MGTTTGMTGTAATLQGYFSSAICFQVHLRESWGISHNSYNTTDNSNNNTYSTTDNSYYNNYSTINNSYYNTYNTTDNSYFNTFTHHHYNNNG